MAEIPYKQFKEHVAVCREGGFPPIYLVFGEAFLCRQAIDALIGELIPSESDRAISLDTIDTGEGEGVYDAVERLNTFSFFTGRKVILLKAANLFASGFNPGKQLDKIRAAVDQQAMQKAARLLLELTDRQGCRPEDLPDASSAEIARILKIDPDAFPDLSWLEPIARQCDANSDRSGGVADDAGVLKNAIEKGFPNNHHLIILTDNADKRTGLFKAIKSCGAAINCTVPTGNRKADRDEQRRVLGQLAREMLARHDKSFDGPAFDRIFHLTGFDPGSFLNSLEKVVHYAANQPRITVEDVAAVLDQSRDDPIYLFTGAIAERNADSALYYLSSLLASGFHYMQLLSAMVNQVRKMMVVRGIMDNEAGGVWQSAMPFDRFRDRVMPAVVAHDESVSAYVRTMSAGLHQGGEKGKSGKSSTDLLIAKNPNNAYPVYQTFLQADRFETPEFARILEALHAADVKLKTTGQAPRAILESLIFEICRKTPA